MKKIVIYLLTLMMVLSPAAAFADTEAEQVPEESAAVVEAQDQEEEAVSAPGTEETEEAVIEEAAEAADEEAPAEEAPAEEAAPEDAAQPVEEAVEPEAAQEVVLEAAAGETKAYGDNDECFWVEGSGRTKAVNKNGDPVYGLFKAQRSAGKLGLYYADETNGTVVAVEGLVTPKNGNQFVYTMIDGETGWTVTGGGPYTYLIKNHDGDYYITNVLEGLETAGGKTYFVKNGMVKTAAGTQDFSGAKYYIKASGEVQMTAGFTPDHKYYIPKTDGKILTTQGTFKANDGKTYYAGAGGVIPSAAGLYTVGSNKYYVNADGSVRTNAGFITVGGKKYLVNAGGAIRNTAGPVAYGGYRYVAEPGGAIRTTKGIYKAGGKIYYVSNSAGVLKVNKSFKASGKGYHALADGTIAVGVHKWGKYYYYSQSSGAVRKKVGVVKWNNNYYHVKKTGKVTTDKKIKYKGKYYIARKNGAIYKRIFTWKKNMYYSSAKGVLRTKAGLFQYDGNRYYSRKGGKLYRNTLFSAGGKKYLANNDARIQYGYLTWQGKHYLTNDKGAIYTKEGKYTYNKVEYFVKKGGAMADKEFVTYNDDHYYINADGSIAKKAFTYKKIKITPNSKTGIISLEDYWKVFPDEKPSAEQDNN